MQKLHKLGATVFGCFLLTACSTVTPASTAGECKIFHAPGFVVQGVRTQDKRWIAQATEAGVKGCGWSRPKE